MHHQRLDEPDAQSKEKGLKENLLIQQQQQQQQQMGLRSGP